MSIPTKRIEEFWLCNRVSCRKRHQSLETAQRCCLGLETRASIRKAANQRRLAAGRLRESGLTYKAIGIESGVSAGRAYQIVVAADKEEKYEQILGSLRQGDMVWKVWDFLWGDKEKK